MADFLETLKSRLEEAQKRLQDKHQKLLALQADFQSVSQEVAGWQKAVEVESRKGQQDSQRSQTRDSSGPVVAAESATAETNKTAMVRDLLRQYPTGATPGELWKAVAGRIKHRPYLYSILARLKEKDEVCVKRGKYSLKVVVKNEGEVQERLLQ